MSSFDNLKCGLGRGKQQTGGLARNLTGNGDLRDTEGLEKLSGYPWLTRKLSHRGDPRGPNRKLKLVQTLKLPKP